MENKVFIVCDRGFVSAYYSDGTYQNYNIKSLGINEICEILYNEICVKILYNDWFKIEQYYEIYLDTFMIGGVMYDIFTQKYNLKVNEMKHRDKCKKMKIADLNNHTHGIPYNYKGDIL